MGSCFTDRSGHEKFSRAADEKWQGACLPLPQAPSHSQPSTPTRDGQDAPVPPSRPRKRAQAVWGLSPHTGISHCILGHWPVPSFLLLQENDAAVRSRLRPGPTPCQAHPTPRAPGSFPAHSFKEFSGTSEVSLNSSLWSTSHHQPDHWALQV